MTQDPYRQLGGQPQAAADAASAVALASRAARAFVHTALAGNLYEIEAARIALQRSGSDAVRGLAQAMLTDHQALGAKVRHALPELEGVDPVEAKLDGRREDMLDNLREAPRAGFDQRYLDQQLAAHREALTLFRGYAECGGNAELKGLAAAAAPILETQLEHVIGLRGR